MKEKAVFRRRQLPHWDVPGGTYFITTCLEGSIPEQGLLDIAEYSRQLSAQRRPEHQTPEEREANIRRLHIDRVDEWLDQRPARRVLEQSSLAQEVVDALFYFAGSRYDLFAYCVMPSHYHWLFRPRDAWVASLTHGKRFRSPRERIQQSINRHTAVVCNRILKQQGPFWQDESYDHWIRNLDEFERIVAYIELNPVGAMLVSAPEDWRYSSAYFRVAHKLERGAALAKQ